MSTPQPMATPNLADLLTKRPTAARRPPKTPAGPPARDHEPTPAATPVHDEPERTVEPNHPAAFETVAVEADPRVDTAVAEPAQGHDRSPAVGERQYLRSIAIYLPRSVHQQLGLAAAERKTTRTALILGAINTTHESLGRALADEVTPPPSGRELFSVPQDRTTSEPSVQTTIRVTDVQHAAIETLVAENKTNRSRLIATALRLYLPINH